MEGTYSCDTAEQTLEWIKAIIDFLKPYTFLTDAHVVNFFKDRLWEAVDKDWIECLSDELVKNLLLIPSGVVQDNWPASLKEFVCNARLLALPSRQADLEKVLPGLHVTSLGPVLSQGMNMKKKHEVEVLSAVVNSVAKSVKAQTVVDVGAGQGYLSQVLAFQYQLSVIAIESSSHHVKVTDERAERIRKHYAAQIRKHLSPNWTMSIPKTVICRVMSADTLKTLSHSVGFHDKQPTLISDRLAKPEETTLQLHDMKVEGSLILTGLHACGDLSVTMLRSFSECEDIKAVVSLGCCYNLLSEEFSANSDSQHGFPVSNALKWAGFCLGKHSRDLACQSADRWRNLGEDSCVHNFERHVFRAAFQLVIDKYYPNISCVCPAVGRQGKSLRRQQWRGSVLDQNSTCDVSSISKNEFDKTLHTDKYPLFEAFCHKGLYQLGLELLPDIKLLDIWNAVEPFNRLAGPYWSLRSVLGPLLETLILLDRLLYLQEQGNQVEAFMVPIFNPVISPRNVAIIARRV